MGAEPLARIVAIGVAGVDPAVMGIGPIPAIRKALAAAQLDLGQIGRVEINEAFAAQVLACQRELGIDPEILNVNGGAIALGHPLGCSGARLAGTLARELKREGFATESRRCASAWPGTGDGHREPRCELAPSAAQGARRSVRVVILQPPAGWRLRVALRRVLPLLLAPERRHVEVAPGASQRLVAACIHEIGAEDLIALIYEHVVAMPLVDSEVGVEIIGDLVPGDVIPAVPLLQALDLGDWSAGNEREEVSRALRCAGFETWSATMEQPRQALSG